MERVYTIGADTHCGFTELATISPGGRLVRRDRCPTTIAALVQAVAEIRSPRVMVIGLERRGSGDGPMLVRVSRYANRVLKNVILGAALPAIASGRSPFAEQHRRWLKAGISSRNARRNVARSLATVMWGMWKSGDDYRPEWVGTALGREPVVLSD